MAESASVGRIVHFEPNDDGAQALGLPAGGPWAAIVVGVEEDGRPNLTIFAPGPLPIGPVRFEGDEEPLEVEDPGELAADASEEEAEEHAAALSAHRSREFGTWAWPPRV